MITVLTKISLHLAWQTEDLDVSIIFLFRFAEKVMRGERVDGSDCHVLNFRSSCSTRFNTLIDRVKELGISQLYQNAVIGLEIHLSSIRLK